MSMTNAYRTNSKPIVTTWQEALEVLDGQEYTLDGIHGRFELNGQRPYQRLLHQPSKRGQRSAQYLKTKAMLRDHWSTDLTNSERSAAIAEEFVEFRPARFAGLLGED
jgi:hypothetical protein